VTPSPKPESAAPAFNVAQAREFTPGIPSNSNYDLAQTVRIPISGLEITDLGMALGWVAY
jgi:hypothetical protein